MDDIELGFQIAHGMILLMLLVTVTGAILSGWWGWKNRDWFLSEKTLRRGE